MDFVSQWRDVLAGVLNQTIERLALYLPNILGAVFFDHPHHRHRCSRILLVPRRCNAIVFYALNISCSPCQLPVQSAL